MTKQTKKATCFALLAAVLYAINSPCSKLLLEKIPSTMMAAFLYLGAGLGLFLVGVVQRATGRKEKEQPLTRRELPCPWSSSANCPVFPTWSRWSSC